MVKFDASTSKGEQTRNLILASALELFRENGFDQTTMLQIAQRASVAKSAAYYYFPSKEAIVQAYYQRIQDLQEQQSEALFLNASTLKARLNVAMHSKLDLVRNDRNLLGVIFRYSGEPNHPLSCLGPQTADVRHRAMAIFRRAIEPERLPKDLAQLLPLALWALQMGLIVLFLYDNSPDQQRTRNLADGALALTLKLLVLAKLPLLKPIWTRVLALLREADLLPQLA